MKTSLPVAVAFLTGLALVVTFFLNEEATPAGRLSNELLNWVIIIGGFTLLLGMVSIWRVNWRAVARRERNWVFRIATLTAMVAMAVPALLPAEWSPLFGRSTGSFYLWVFDIVQAPMMATMFAMLAFFIASAAYRAFRARSAEATVLLITAVLVMLWRVPMGEALLNLLPGDVPAFLNTYIMNGANLAVQRGIVVGAALGAAAMSLRIILGIERTYMGRS